MTKEQQYILAKFGCDAYEDLAAEHLALIHDIARADTNDPHLRWLYGYADYMNKNIYKYEKASVAANN